MSLNYTGLKKIRDKITRQRCAGRLLDMRKTLAPVRNRKSETSLLLATWNIRDFDSNKFKWGPRLEETYYYLAEMISAFDLVAIQEVNRDLAPLRKLMKILGREWDYIVTDVSEGWSGNGERMAYIFNREKVYFRKIAGEIVLPDGQLIVSEKTVKDDEGNNEVVEDAQQFSRSPYLVAFQSGWFKFSLCTVHIYFGSASGAKLKKRIAEIKRLVTFFADRQDKENKQTRDALGDIENYILLGDFNVVSPQHKTMEALKSKGFKVPDSIDGNKVRKKGEHYYDQIAVRVKDPRFKVVGGGMLDMFGDVFKNTKEDKDIYASKVPDKDPEKNSKYAAKTADGRYKKWRTWQMSDHNPLWIEIETDFSDHYIAKIAEDVASQSFLNIGVSIMWGSRMNCFERVLHGFLVSVATVLMPLSAIAQDVAVAELTEGLWAEGLDFDPFGRRPVQLWLPEGTLLFEIKKSDRVTGARAFKYRVARTFHGYPVNLELVPKRGVFRYKTIGTPNSEPRFRLLHSVYCPGETNPIVTSSSGCNFGEPVGEGWVFELAKGETTHLGARLRATAYPDAKTIAKLGQVSSGIYTFDMYERDLDLFEKQGVLFRLDRDHPLSSFHFVDDYFFPCNTKSTVEIKEEEIVKAFAEASVEAEFGFWSWFKAKASAGAGFEDKGSSISSTRTEQDSSEASVFSQWGIMKTTNGVEVPFYVEKRFDCQSGVGTTKPGDWITSVEISFWNSDDDVNDVYEFNTAIEWVEMDKDEMRKRHQRPVFFSINDSDKQARVIQNILKEYPELSYDQAVFIFAQLNNGCGGRFRDDCNSASKVVEPQSLDGSQQHNMHLNSLGLSVSNTTSVRSTTSSIEMRGAGPAGSGLLIASDQCRSGSVQYPWTVLSMVTVSDRISPN